MNADELREVLEYGYVVYVIDNGGEVIRANKMIHGKLYALNNIGVWKINRWSLDQFIEIYANDSKIILGR